MMHSPARIRDPLLLDLEVPCVCNYNAYCVQPNAFLDIPESHGLHWDTVHFPEFSSLDTSEKAASFLQGWLFFAMLNRVSSLFGVNFQAADFVKTESLPQISSTLQSSTRVSGKAFNKYIWLWTGAIFYRTLDEQRTCITKVRAFLDLLHKAVNAWLEQDYVPITPTFDRILLSLELLGESLAYVMPQIFPSAMVEETFKIPYRWTCSGYLRERLIKVGWCKGELPLLLEKCQPAVLLFLSSIERTRRDKDHSRCDRVKGCIVNRLDHDTYQPSHAADCLNNAACTMLQTSVEEVSNLITTGNTPLVTVTSNESGTTTLQTHSLRLNDKSVIPSYVAISHVWSDGMGNPKVNAVQSCQLRHIQSAVNALYHSDSKLGKQNSPVPFWMDTLCVPLRSDARPIAIARMAKTFFHAEKVLVMDNWLRQNRTDAHAREMLIKVAHCDWNTRLWTFHEAMLARNCYFQFNDHALSLDELKDTPETSGNLQEVSEMLLTIDKKEILREQSTMNLLRALTSVDPNAVKAIHEYSSLPPQSDPDTETLRLHAIEQRQKVERVWEFRRLWAPVLEQADVQRETKDTDQAENLRAHIETRILDPLLAHGLDAFFRLRGFIYNVQASRTHDLASSAHTTLTGFNSSPVNILRDVSRGLPRRTTSRLEDETICLGNIIGSDITPLLAISVPEGERNEEVVQQVCAERMKKFLSSIKILPASVLFWDTHRMADYPWRWASRSFLQRNACAAMFGTDNAEVTTQGLKARYRGISIKLNKYSDIQKSFRTLRLQHVDPSTGEVIKFDDRSEYQQSWECLELLEPVPLPWPWSSPAEKKQQSWHDLFAEAKNTQLALITFTQQKLDGVLVSILRDEQGVIFAKLLANVVRVDGGHEPEYLESYVDATWMSWRTWCVG